MNNDIAWFREFETNPQEAIENALLEQSWFGRFNPAPIWLTLSDFAKARPVFGHNLGLALTEWIPKQLGRQPDCHPGRWADALTNAFILVFILQLESVMQQLRKDQDEWIAYLHQFYDGPAQDPGHYFSRAINPKEGDSE